MSETTEPNKARLRALVRTLDKIPDPNHRLKMDVFCQEKECGTVACLAGWYAKLNPSSGLRLTFHGFIGNVAHRNGKGVDFARHFGISDYDEGRLFYPDTNKGIGYIRRRVVSIVKRYGVKVS